MSAGVFVVVEGIDGAGTTTQTARAAERLRAAGRLVHVTREPSTGPIGAFVRELLTGQRTLPSAPSPDLMALLFAADRLDHVRGEIERELARGAVVLSDRYDLSSLTYQSLAEAEEPEGAARVAWVRELNRFARRPDATIVVDVDPAVAAARRAARGGPPELYETTALQARLAAAYARAEELLPGDRVVHVDGNADLDEVTARFWAALAPLVGGDAAP